MLLAYIIQSTITKTKRLKLVEVVFLLKEITNHEMDLRFEAAAANEYSENTKNDAGFYVPKIYSPNLASRPHIFESCANSTYT